MSFTHSLSRERRNRAAAGGAAGLAAGRDHAAALFQQALQRLRGYLHTGYRRMTSIDSDQAFSAPGQFRRRLRCAGGTDRLQNQLWPLHAPQCRRPAADRHGGECLCDVVKRSG